MELSEAELDCRYFILKTDHKNLTYINATFVGKILRWKLYLQDKNFSLEHVAGKDVDQSISDALSRLCVNIMPDNKSGPKRRPMMVMLVAFQPIQKIPQLICKKTSRVCNSEVGQWAL